MATTDGQTPIASLRLWAFDTDLIRRMAKYWLVEVEQQGTQVVLFIYDYG